MAVPVVHLVRPGRGWSAGGTLVQIDGGGFRMPSPPAAAPRAPVPRPPPSVEVLFDGIPSPHVEVVSTTILRCVTPPHPPDRTRDDKVISRGTVDVVVRNIDEGAPILGESATAARAYAFVRPELGSKQVRGAWLRVVDAFLEHLRCIALENVAWNPAVDFDANTGDVRGYVDLASAPGIAVTRVGFPDSDSEPEGGPYEVDATEEIILLRRAAVASDIVFTLVLVSNGQGELVNLAEVIKTCFRDASSFQVQIDPNDASHGMATFSMILTSPLQLSERVGNTNVVTAEAPGMIARVLSVDLPGAPMEGLPGVPGWIGHQGTRATTRHAEILRAAVRAKG